jgi:hypothetical protein
MSELNYENFPVPTKFRDELILQLGILTIAKANRELYDKVLDELRGETNKSIGGRNGEE